MFANRIKMIKRLEVYRLVEYVFLILTGLYLLFLAEKNTTFKFEYTTDVEEFLINAIKIVTILKLILFLWSKRYDIRGNRGFLRSIVLFLLCAAGIRVIYHMVYHEDKYRFLVFLGILTIGVIGTDYKKIMKVHFVTVGLMTGAAVLASLSGFIINYAYLKDGGLVHSSWGIVYSTDYASIMVFLCLSAWIAWRDTDPKTFLMPGILSFLNALFIAHSNTSTILSVLFLVAVIYEGFHNKKGKRIVALIIELLFPLFAIFTLGATYLFHKGTWIGIKLDSFFHGRLSWISNGFKEYKLSAFGTPFNQSGGGGSTFWNQNYNFIDNTYGLIILRYGMVFFAVIMILWVLMTRKAIKMGHWRLALGLGLIAFHSFSEHHFTEINYNILIILPFSVLGMGWLVKERESSRTASEYIEVSSSGIRFVIFLITIGIAALFIMLGGPHLLSIFRTIFDITEDIKFKDKEKIICAAFIMIIIALITIAVAIYKLLYLSYRKLKDRSICVKNRMIIHSAVVLFVVIIFITGIIAGKKIIDIRGQAYFDVVSAEKPAINAVMNGIKESGGSFYADEVPYIYQKTYGCFTDAFIQGDELAETSDATVIMDADYESQPLLGMGFLYTEISGDHAIYTNDADVIKELESAGYHLTGYFSRKREVDLKEEAERNNIEYASDGIIRIEGGKSSLRYGPYYDLRGGKYTVTYELTLPEIDAYDEDYKVCTLRIGLRWGASYVAEVPVFRSEFDDGGRIKKEIIFGICDTRACEFKISAENGRTVLLDSITCQKTPDMDVHMIYDGKGRVVREEYYDFSGNPIASSEGYHAVEYEYDKRDLKSICRYFDTEDNPVTTTSGYAAIGYKYDVRKRVIRETYYGEDGLRLVMPEGHSAVVYGYDAAGNRNEYRYYDTENQPVMLTGGYSTLRKAFDDKKRIICEEFFDTEGRPVIIPGGYAKIAYDYYEDTGWEILRSLYGEDGKLIDADSKYAQRYRMIDKDGRVLRYEYFDSEGRRTMVDGGYSIEEHEYDRYDNLTDIYYYDEYENPVLYGGEYFHLHREFNVSHQLIKETRYDTSDNAIVLPEGYATIEYDYDEIGNQTEVAFYDVDGKPVLWWGHYHRIYRIFNEKKQNIREEYLDLDGQVMMRDDGFASTEREYDEAGNMIEQRYLDMSGVLSLNTGGYAILRRDYDSSNRITKEYYLGLNNEPVNCTNGYSTIEYTYDSDGNHTSTVYYNTKGEVVEQK